MTPFSEYNSSECIDMNHDGLCNLDDLNVDYDIEGNLITGDITQVDLPAHDQSGLIDAANILKEVDGLSFVYFDETDVVRHKLVKNIIKAYANNDTKKKNDK